MTVPADGVDGMLVVDSSKVLPNCVSGADFCLEILECCVFLSLELTQKSAEDFAELRRAQAAREN